MKIWIAVYIVILLSLWRQYRKIKKNPEKYDDMEAIYQYEPKIPLFETNGSSAWRNCGRFLLACEMQLQL